MRAPQAHNNVRKNIYIDARNLWQLLYDELPKYKTACTMVTLQVALSFYAATFSFIAIVFIPILTVWASRLRANKILPMHLPLDVAEFDDYRDNPPGQRNEYNKARGSINLGNAIGTNEEIWTLGLKLLTHLLILGATGSGKTDMLLSLAGSTAFSMAGGVIYIDAKAAKSLLYSFATLAQLFGRMDDLRVINYSTGNQTISMRHWLKKSNTSNPFARGDANTGAQTLMGLLPPSGGDNQFFLDRAISALTVLMPVLCELRDHGHLNIYPSLIGHFISLRRFIQLANNKIIMPPRIGEQDGEELTGVTISDKNRSQVIYFLKNLQVEDLSKENPSKHPEEARRLFGYAEGYFARTLANLAGTYGHIYETELAEAEYTNVINQNLLLIVLIPAMEQSKDELSALGKVVLSSIRIAMSMGLGDESEGDYEDVIENLPIDIKIPSIIIIDEYAQIAVPNFSVTATQGRGLGISCVFSGQDLPGFYSAGEEDADMIISNTLLKIQMRLEDPNKTWEAIKTIASTMDVHKDGGVQSGSGINTYQRQNSATVEKVDRVAFLDLKRQIEGEAHLFFDDQIIRARLFHFGLAKKKIIKNFRYNRMLKIKSPPKELTFKHQENIIHNLEYHQRLDEPQPAPIAEDPLFRQLAKTGRNVNSIWRDLLSQASETTPEEPTEPDEQISDPTPKAEQNPPEKPAIE
jgi:intracellular multiplication protein IcmO